MCEPEETCDIPEDIPDDEKIVRAIKTPFYFHKTRKGELIPKALFPPYDASDVSVTRHCMGDDYCANRSRLTVKPEQAESYYGMLVFRAGDARNEGSRVYDYRDDFCGHAHVNHGVEMPARGETMDPRERKQLDDRCKAILSKGVLHPDRHDAGPGWKGAPL